MLSCAVRGLPLALVLCAAGVAIAQEDEEQPYLPGMIATYRNSQGAEVQRVEPTLYSQEKFRRDTRLSDASEVRYQGLLWAQGSGQYRLHAYGEGKMQVRLAGKLVIEKTLSGWFSSDPIELSFDYHPLEVRTSGGRHHRTSLFWSGPQFTIEPIAPRFLWHDRPATVPADFEHGRLLDAAFRCTACHVSGLHDAPILPAPSLVRLHDNLSRSWLIDRLMESAPLPLSVKDDSEKSLGSVNRQMPYYGLPRDQAEAIAAYLLKKRDSVPAPLLPVIPKKAAPRQKPPSAKSKSGKRPEQTAPSIAEGERLFLTLGCLACHQMGELGEGGLFGGGDLTNIATKRPAAFFDRWLADPASLNPRHRMPIFDLTADERKSLSLFLAAAGKPANAEAGLADDMHLVRGRELVRQLQCASCHELAEGPQPDNPRQGMVLNAQSDWNRSCAGPKDKAKSGWGYDLSPECRDKLRAYLVIAPTTSEPKVDGGLLLLTNNCLACHPREGYEKYARLLPRPLADKLASVGREHDELAPLIPSMTPPSLNGVGDKLTSSALAAAIQRTGPAHRSYLLVRMPRFSLAGHAEGALTDHLQSMDQLPPGAPIGEPVVDHSQTALAAAGGRLVSTDGFGCVSCHQIGSVIPDKAPLNARGPNLSRLDQRIRRAWFDRFIPNPARIVPRMEMPSVQVPVKGVLQDRVDSQIAAVWHVLTTPGFEPPEPNPVRVLRTSGIAGRKESPIVINDVTKIGERTFIHPLVIGLPNRQNFLFDLEEGRLSAWWLGDTARQRTKGKSWHWEPGGPLLLQENRKSAELAILRGNERLVPRRQGQHVAMLREYDVSPEAVRVSYALQLGPADDPAAPSTSVAVTEVWTAGSAEAPPRVVRQLSAQWDAREGDRLVCELAPASLAKESAVSATELEFEQGRIQLDGDNADWRVSADGSATGPPMTAAGKQASFRVAYLPQIAPDTIDAPSLSFAADADPIEVAPGFVGRRLPLPGDMMPTALAWRSAAGHDLLVGSLKGQVLAAADSDRDGLEDAVSIVADGLATPYGIHDGGDGLHVLTKGALLNATPRGVKVLASGWGHTDDYHDWAVGLPRNERGEYFIGLPCQQDERSAAAAKYRGAVLKLIPRTPTADDPRHFEPQVVTTGHRFPMGMALNRAGQLFVTDNQGNYNPFNELNHVRPGAFFGFINVNEKKDKSFQPPPLDSPAIDIPHPWTRSVNGICFLETPQALLDRGTRDIFGPLEGQLVGCEYDTRRLIRMSLQRVGDTYQGAAYPLSLEPSSPEKGFLGPVVCAVSPRGELYIGSIRDSGWGAGNNIGEVVQVKIVPDELPAGIAEMRVIKTGFEIDFLREVDAARAADPANYSLSSYRRESTPAYGGSDLDRRIERIDSIQVAPDRRSATIEVGKLREGFVYELQLKNFTDDGGVFYPAEAHYTLRQKP